LEGRAILSEPIVYIDSSTIRDGKLQELEAGMKELAGFVEANEPQMISYGFFLDRERTRMTLIAIHPDAASMEFHLEVAGPLFRKFRAWIDMKSIDIYGRPSAKVLAQLREKARMLGCSSVAVHELHSGFDRFGHFGVH
jgi:hypothetical protein